MATMMTPHEFRQQIHRLLDRHADALAALRASRVQMDAAFKASDEAVGSAIDANDAALTLLTCFMDDDRIKGLERALQALAAEIEALKQQVHRVTAIGQPFPRSDIKDKP